MSLLPLVLQGGQNRTPLSPSESQKRINHLSDVVKAFCANQEFADKVSNILLRNGLTGELILYEAKVYLGVAVGQRERRGGNWNYGSF